MTILPGTSAAPEAVRAPTPALVSYAIDGLRRCWMPELGRFSYRYRFDAAPPNQSMTESDAFYSLNVLLGLSRLAAPRGCEYLNLTATYNRCCSLLRSTRTRNYALGMALWAGAALDIEPPDLIIDRVRVLLTSPSALSRSSAQDIGMLASGATAMALKHPGDWRSAAEALVNLLQQHYCDSSSGLFYNQGKGYRRRFSSFASQVYSMLALYQFGEAFDRDWAIAVANRAAARVIGLQGRRGEWGWFYYVPRASVVDFYEIYSVHQHGMAPAFLHHAAAHGVTGARDALMRGFRWLFGDNEMGVSMLRPAERMFYRSQLRRGELKATRQRVFRSIANAVRGRSDGISRHSGLALRHECRSYELGWILWSFGGRSDYRELTDRGEFAA
jgi:hypothetical protein